MKVLVARNDKLGDFILALPVCYALKASGFHVCVLVSPLGAELAHFADFIDDVIVDDKTCVLELSKQIKALKIDVFLAVFSNFKVGLAGFLARVPKRIAPKTKLAQIFYTHKVYQHRSSCKMSEFEYNLDLLRSVIPNINTHYPLPLFNFTSDVFDEFCKQNNVKKIIIFHLGFGGSSSANLNANEYLSLAKIALQQSFTPCFTFGPNEFDMQEKVEKMVDFKAVFYRSDKGIVHFAKFLSKTSCFCSTSTGVYHLASALNVPVFGFFGQKIASFKRWRGLGDKEHNYELPNDNEPNDKNTNEKNARDKVVEKIKNDFNKFLGGLNG